MRKMRMKLFDVTYENGTCATVVAYDFASAEHVAHVAAPKLKISEIKFTLDVLVYR